MSIATRTPWGPKEIATYCDVQRATVDRWGQRDLLPAPDGQTSGRPYWWPEQIIRWADATGRRAIAGHLWRFHAHTDTWAGADGVVEATGQDEAVRHVRAWCQRVGVREHQAQDTDGGELFIEVWDADWSIPQLPAETSLEVWDYAQNEPDNAPRLTWSPVITVTRVHHGDSGVSVRSGGFTRREEFTKLRLPGAATTITGEPATADEPAQPREAVLWAEYDPALYTVLMSMEAHQAADTRTGLSWFGTNRPAGRPNSHEISDAGRLIDEHHHLQALIIHLGTLKERLSVEPPESSVVEGVIYRRRLNLEPSPDVVVAAIDRALAVAVPGSITWTTASGINGPAGGAKGGVQVRKLS